MFSTSCTDWLDVNKNVDSPEWVPPVLRLAPTIAAYEGIAYDLRAVAPMVQYFGGTNFGSTNFGGTFGSSHGYFSGSDNAGEAWRMVYWVQGMNIEDIINDSRSQCD